jgi:hypothetical protein
MRSDQLNLLIGQSMGNHGTARAGETLSVSDDEPSTGFLHRRQRSLRPRQGAGADVDAGGLGGDRDLLAGRGVAAEALLLRGLDPDGELHEPADPNLLGVGEPVKDDGFERVEDALGVGLGELGALSDGGEQLRLGQRHGHPSLSREMSTIIEADIESCAADAKRGHSGRYRTLPRLRRAGVIEDRAAWVLGDGGLGRGRTYRPPSPTRMSSGREVNA